MTAASNPSAGAAAGAKDTAQGAPSSPPLRKNGLRRAAIAILLLGDELTKKLLRHFQPDQVRRLMSEATNMRGVTEEEVLEVLEDLVKDFGRDVPGISGQAYRIEEAAVSVFGADLLRQTSNKDIAGIAVQLHAVASEKPDLFARTIQKEHPQTVAVILSLLPTEVAGAVLRHLTPDAKADIVRRVAKLRTVSSNIVADVAEKVGRELVRPAAQGPINIDGMDMAVKLLKVAGVAEEQPILEELERTDMELSQKLKSKLFVFEDLRLMHERELQLVLREIDQRLLPPALKNASPELQAKLLSNVSKRAAEMLRDDMKAMGPVTVQQVEDAQQQILRQVLALAAEGRVNIRPGTTL